MKRALVAIAAGLLIVPAQAQNPEKALRALFNAQLTAGQRSDVNGYMATIDPAARSYEPTKAAMQQVFGLYKLSFQLKSLKVLKSTATTAEVQTEVVTKKVSGPAFRNNRVVSLNLCVKKGGKWLVSASKVDKIEYLQ